VADRRLWLVGALVPLAVLAAWFLGDRRGPDTLLLWRGHEVSTALVLVLAAGGLGGAMAAAAWRPPLGLALMAAVLLGMAAFWPAVQENPFSGPTVVSFGRRGLHENDLLAVVPGVAGLAAAAAAWHLHVRRRS
jgi:hypothetical protein